MAGGENMHDGPMAQGKIEAIADVDGLFKVDVDRLYAINSIGELTIVTRFNNTPVKAGDKLAGMRCIPLDVYKRQQKRRKPMTLYWWQSLNLWVVKIKMTSKLCKPLYSPVSYTHLDVYKRQRYGCAHCETNDRYFI